MQCRGSWGKGQVSFPIHKVSHLFRRAEFLPPVPWLHPGCEWRVSSCLHLEQDTHQNRAGQGGGEPCHAAHSRPFRRREGPPNVEVTTRRGWIASKPGTGSSTLNGPSLPRRTGLLPWSGRLLTRGGSPFWKEGPGEIRETGNPYTRLC